MKRIEAFVKPFTFESIRQALSNAGFGVQRILQVEEFGRESIQESFSGTEYSIESKPRLMLLMYVEDKRVDEVIHIIQTNARTDHPGDGRIMISTLDRVAAVTGSE